MKWKLDRPTDNRQVIKLVCAALSIQQLTSTGISERYPKQNSRIQRLETELRFIFNHSKRQTTDSDCNTDMHAEEQISSQSTSRLDLARLLTLVEEEHPEDERHLIQKLGEEIRVARLKSGYSYSEFATLVGIETETLLAVENGIGNLATAQSIHAAFLHLV